MGWVGSGAVGLARQAGHRAPGAVGIGPQGRARQRLDGALALFGVVVEAPFPAVRGDA